MLRGKVKDLSCAWFVGNFKDAAYQTSLFEVGIKTVTKQSDLRPHTHVIAAELALILHGILLVNGKRLYAGDWYKLDAGEPCVAEVESPSVTALVVKYPSCPNDKQFIGDAP